MAKLNDISGQKFGCLTVVNRGEDYECKSGKYVRWNCICKCGKRTLVRTSDLKSGHIQSCGCLRLEAIKNPNNTDLEKQCPSCKLVLPNENFNFLNNGKHFSYCSRCRYFMNIKRMHGLTEDNFFLLMEKQNYICPICFSQLDFIPGERKIVIDHCHDTGKIRGIVHPECNLLLINKHTVTSAKRLLDYLVFHAQDSNSER